MGIITGGQARQVTQGRYTYRGSFYTIFGSGLVEAFSSLATNGFEVRRCEACNLLKLRRQMMNAAVTGPISDLRKGKLVVQKQLLYSFDAL